MNKLMMGLLLLCYMAAFVQAEDKKVLQKDNQPVAQAAEKISPMTVEQCVKYAYTHSPDLKRLELRMANRKFDTVIAKAAFDLGLSLTSKRNTESQVDTHTVSLNQEIPGGFNLKVSGSGQVNDISNTQSADLSVALSKVLLGGGSIEESMQGIRDGLVNELISLNNIRKEKRNINFRVKRQFYRIIRNLQGLEIQLRRLERSKKNLEHAKERERPLDIATAEIDIPETELNVLAAKRRIATELDSLKVLMGMPADREIKISEKFDFKLEAPSLKQDLLYAEKFEESFVNNELEKRKLERSLRIRQSATDVDLSIKLEHNVASEGDETANLNGRDEQVLTMNLNWDLGQRADNALFAKAKNDLDDNAVGKYILRQQKMRTLRDLERRLDETEKSVTIQQLRIKLNERQVELFKDRWENGEIDILEYIRSQNRLEDSKVQLINLKTNYMEFLAEYLFEVGK